MALLRNLGFLINLEKSDLHPKKQFTFLGLEKCIFSEEAILELRWWSTLLIVIKRLSPALPSVAMSADASGSGWGATWGTRSLAGTWEARDWRHINPRFGLKQDRPGHRSPPIHFSLSPHAELCRVRHLFRSYCNTSLQPETAYRPIGPNRPRFLMIAELLMPRKGIFTRDTNISVQLSRLFEQLLLHEYAQGQDAEEGIRGLIYPLGIWLAAQLQTLTSWAASVQAKLAGPHEEEEEVQRPSRVASAPPAFYEDISPPQVEEEPAEDPFAASALEGFALPAVAGAMSVGRDAPKATEKEAAIWTMFRGDQKPRKIARDKTERLYRQTEGPFAPPSFPTQLPVSQQQMQADRAARAQQAQWGMCALAVTRGLAKLEEAVQELSGAVSTEDVHRMQPWEASRARRADGLLAVARQATTSRPASSKGNRSAPYAPHPRNQKGKFYHRSTRCGTRIRLVYSLPWSHRRTKTILVRKIWSSCDRSHASLCGCFKVNFVCWEKVGQVCDSDDSLHVACCMESFMDLPGQCL
ncbi:hypothetical protein CAPTEDRAFT_219704 [Capitella teleta]|uniref:Uncharacterized protein n=1 Tax=Capitella teleta TaxID=283909 RepID=R7UD01_CAPTE|nr:hypothetical protein CAPTEDRAFT_219704 [Capitella teleta]|eukprot:ELU01142.1 hypothetical protein CAPTEDRAFT_219704 [Capitella teleta]